MGLNGRGGREVPLVMGPKRKDFGLEGWRERGGGGACRPKDKVHLEWLLSRGNQGYFARALHGEFHLGSKRKRKQL